MLVSVEKTLTKKEGFIDALISGFALGSSEAQRQDALSFITTDSSEYLAKTVFTKSKGIHPAGLCAFDIDMSNLKLPNNRVKVEVIVQGDVAPLKGGEAYI
jgi:hypothetical protein